MDEAEAARIRIYKHGTTGQPPISAIRNGHPIPSHATPSHPIPPQSIKPHPIPPHPIHLLLPWDRLPDPLPRNLDPDQVRICMDALVAVFRTLGSLVLGLGL